jgi:methylmalonyl-CoA mutase C-terminal domain/subunit
VIAELKQRGGGDVVVFGGGIVPDVDLPALTAAGVAKVFTPGATTQEIIAWVREHVRARAA